MSTLLSQLRARPHLMLSVAAGVVTALSLAAHPWVTRLLVAWNVIAWSYLVQAAWVMSRQDHHHLRRTAIAQSAGAGAVLTVVIAAAIASVTAIAFELARVKSAPPGQAWAHITLALSTVASSWLLLPTLFSLTYASLFHQRLGGRGLLFPGEQEADPPDPPDYWDFLYFSFTIAVASQTADVAIASNTMRRLVLLQSVLSFAFNTAILALMVNIAAGLI